MAGNDASSSTVTDTTSNANIATWLTSQAAIRPDAPAVKQGELTISYARLDDASARAAALLEAHGVKAGDRVSLIMPNVAYFPIAYYGILRLGAVVVPTNPLLKAGEISYVWQDSEVSVAVVLDMFAPEAEKAAKDTGTEVITFVPGRIEQQLADHIPRTEITRRDPDDTVVILYTSGTTGRPKGAELTQHNISSNVITSVDTLFHGGPDDVIFGGLPLFHSFGQTCAMNTSVYGGSCLALLPRFDPVEALKIIEKEKVTTFLGVPTMYMALLAVPDKESYDTSSLRLAVSGGSSLPVEVLRGVEQTFDLKLLEGYGLSETSPVATFNHPDRPSKPGSVGIPIHGVEIAVVGPDDLELPAGEVGEVVIRGENIMKGYLNKPEATAEAMRNGWFHSGDLGRLDDDGFLFIVDRVKDMIVRNAYNVYPREVEELLFTHPAVAEAAVVGVPHPEHGEEIAALITLKPDAEVTEDEIREWTKERIAAYKYPRIVKFGAIPKGPTGKVLKREIKIN
ncbi:long-chain fatty acid--CoA ligase [Microlunatus sp. Gsoil 973]|uniref:long-chain-fatty-acid--CoA ligase n=1 Tax=Microlunatus sp. Gsoil 973 TaxID=2672569 RepID=UPI0012B486BF|nr:long-chain fatty acid--CoA ligase [Microlunatus sp. Gsoil 973]QGN35008.1 AMP-binding protein [Microlunatus sp. Gsoil 973]